MSKEILDFFTELHRGCQTKFRCMKEGARIIDVNNFFNENAIKELRQLNGWGYEIYFLVNTGGYKGEEINCINSAFMDLDCGRDSDGEYYSLDRVNEYKENKLNEINKFKLPPSYIVETRNGFHVYWFLEGGATVEQFTECQRRLIGFFQADPVVKNAARLMRVPGFYWNKDKENRYLIKIVTNTGARYRIDELMEHLPVVEEKGKSVNNRKEYNTLLSIVDTKTSYLDCSNITLIQQQDVESLQEILNPEGIKLNSHDEVYDYLKKQDLQELLGFSGRTFKCIFHNDNNPSAGVIVNEETGHHVYNCLSQSCNQSLTIIQVIERLTGLSQADTLRFLRRLYRVEYTETEWQKGKQLILQENQRLILSNEFESAHPEVNSMVRRYISELTMLHELAKEHIQTENFTDREGNPVFYASTRYLAQKYGKDKSLVSRRIGILAYLGLIRKVPENEVPLFLMKKAKNEAAKKKQTQTVAFYSIPPYDEQLFQFAKEKAHEFKELGMTVKGWGRELLLRIVGEDEADRVFPQMQGKKEVDDDTVREIELTTIQIIEQKGWVTEREVLEELLKKKSETKVFLEKKIKRIIPEMINKYGLVKQRLNKLLKEQLGIDIEGYPNVILSGETLYEETGKSINEIAR